MNSKIKQIREKLGLKQKEFGEPLGIGLTHVSKYERGEVKPTSEVLEKLANIYKVNLNWLLTGNGEMFLNQKEEPKILEKCDEVREAFLKLPAERQRFYYHKIIAESLE